MSAPKLPRKHQITIPTPPAQHSVVRDETSLEFLHIVADMNTHLQGMVDSLKTLGERMVRTEVLLEETLRRIEGVEKNLSTFATHSDLAAIRDAMDVRSAENDSRLSRIEADLAKLLEDRVTSSRIVVALTSLAAIAGGLASWFFNQVFGPPSPKP